MAVLKLILVLSLLIIPALCLEINFVPLFIKYEQFGRGCKGHSIAHQDVSLFISKDNSQNDWMLSACGSCNFLNEMWLHC